MSAPKTGDVRLIRADDPTPILLSDFASAARLAVAGDRIQRWTLTKWVDARPSPEAPEGLVESVCQGCGRIDWPVWLSQPLDPTQCGHCPPWQCESCGQMDSMAASCSCWTSLAGMATADIKALFARDGGFELAHDITGGE